MKLIDVRMKKLIFFIQIYEELQKSDFLQWQIDAFLFSMLVHNNLAQDAHDCGKHNKRNKYNNNNNINDDDDKGAKTISVLVLGHCEEFECLFSSLDETLLFAEDDEEFVPQLSVKFPPQTV